MRWAALVAGVLALTAGCSSDENAAPETTDPGTTTSTVEPTTSGTAEGPDTTTADEPEDRPPLTHAQFIRRLDRLCRRSNRQLDRSSKRIDAAFARDDYAEAARIWARSNKRLDPPFYKAVDALAVLPEDAKGLARYLALSRQIDVLEVRYIRAVRQRDEDEMSRVGRLMDRISNNRTLATSRMGLTECGG